MALVGVFTLFVKAEYIERNLLVSLATLLACALAGFALHDDYVAGFPHGTGSLVAVSLVAVLGFVAGRLADRALGPLDPPPGGGPDLAA